MVENYLNAHCRHEFIESLGCKAFEECIFFARRAHTVNYIVTRNKVVHHLFNGVDIVLEIGVEAYHGVSVFFRGHKSREQSVLMPLVAGKIYSGKNAVTGAKGTYYIPCVVLRSVVDKSYFALGRYFAAVYHGLHDGFQLP